MRKGLLQTLHKCVLCGNESFSSADNVCQQCIDDFIRIDKSTLPQWLLDLEEKHSFEMLSMLVNGERVTFNLPFRLVRDVNNT